MARDFDGSNDFMNSGTQTLPESMTAMAWCNADSFGSGGDQDILIRDGATNSTFFLEFYDTDSSTQRDLSAGWTGATNRLVDVAPNVFDVDGNFHHALCVGGDAGWELWSDGVSEATATSSWTAAAEVLNFGGKTGGSDCFNGKLGEFVVWSVGLTDNQIVALFHGVNPFGIQPDKLFVYIPTFGNESPEPDYSGTGKTGTVLEAVKASSHPPVELIENYL